MTDRLIRITTALAVVAVAVVAAVISYQHAFELVRSHGESGLTARLLPFTVDGLIWAASMVVLDASRRGQPVPRLAAWSLGTGIVATVGANLAHGVGHGPVGALVSAWPALALVGSFELLMMLIRTGRGTRAGDTECWTSVPGCIAGSWRLVTITPIGAGRGRERWRRGWHLRCSRRSQVYVVVVSVPRRPLERPGGGLQPAALGHAATKRN